jgi:hypothetical protein
MASITVYTLQDKAAFINHLGKFGFNVDSFEIQDFENDDPKNSYFIIDNIDNDLAKDVKELFKNNSNIKVTTSKSSPLKEMLRTIIREEYKRKFGSTKNLS